MKKIVFLSAALFCFGCAFSQDVDYNAIILPANAVNISFEEKLVQLAWKNDPSNHQIAKQVSIAHINMRQAQWSWLDYVAARANLNEFTLNPNASDVAATRAAFYPRYNISIVIPLGTLATNGLEVKKRRVMMSIAEDAIKSKKIAIRAQVLTAYTRYQLAEKKYKIQKETTDQSDVNYKYIEQRFKDGQEDLQTYNNLLERNTNQQLRLAEVEAELKLVKLELEALIGTRLENVPK